MTKINIGDPDQDPDVVEIEPGRNRELARLRITPHGNNTPTVDVEITAREGGEIVTALVAAFLL